MRLVRILPAVITAVLFAAPSFALAQEGGGGGNGGGGGGGGGRGRGMRGMQIADDLKEKLGLTDDQYKQVKAIEDDMRAKMQKAREDMQGGGDQPDFQKMREKMTEMFKEVEEKVKALLTDAQKPKFEEWVKQREEQRRNFGGPGGPGGPGGFGRGPNDKDLADRAEKELTLSPDEKSAVMPLVKKVLETRTEARKNNDTRRQDLQKFLKDVPGTTDAQKEEIAAKIKEIRKAKEADEAKIKEAEAQLREVLTSENEAKLMAMGIL